jgi:SnoaL-like domain
VDAIAEFRAALETNDLDRLADTLAPDAEFISPLRARGVVRGRSDLRVLFAVINSILSELRWTDEIMNGDRGLLISQARIGPFRLDDATVVELDADGRIRRLKPHLRPWLANTSLGLAVGVKMARHPGVLWRSVRRP